MEASCSLHAQTNGQMPTPWRASFETRKESAPGQWRQVNLDAANCDSSSSDSQLRGLAWCTCDCWHYASILYSQLFHLATYPESTQSTASRNTNPNPCRSIWRGSCLLQWSFQGIRWPDGGNAGYPNDAQFSPATPHSWCLGLTHRTLQSKCTSSATTSFNAPKLVLCTHSYSNPLMVPGLRQRTKASAF